MPSTTKTAAFENASGAPLRNASSSQSVTGGASLSQPIEVYDATTLTVTVTIAPSTASSDLTVTLFQANAGLTAPSATTVPPTTHSGPTLSGNITTYTATYNVTNLKKVWLGAANTTGGPLTITATWSNDISSSIDN
jgi:hypothetical protein